MNTQLNNSLLNGKVEGGGIRFDQKKGDRTRYFIPKNDRVTAIKSNISIRDVARTAGISIPEKDDVKFCSPLRQDQNPSCTIHGDYLKDWSQNRCWDVIDFFADLYGTSKGHAIASLYSWVSRKTFGYETLHRVARKIKYIDSSLAALASKTAAQERERKRAQWKNALLPLSPDWCHVLAAERNISLEAIARTVSQGNLYGMKHAASYAWVITDKNRSVAQARLFGGKHWWGTENTKAKTLPGSFGSYPLVGDLQDHHAIALLEGGPDFLALWHHAFVAGVEELVCPVAMLGASMDIPDVQLMKFAGHRVRIFSHADKAGSAAANRWAKQLQSVGCFVDGFDFTGLLQTDGKPVKDLNDVCRLSADSWQANQDVIENMFSFVQEEL